MKTAAFDIDTQLDFLYPAGALYVPGAEAIAAHIAALNRWAAGHGIPVVSTMCAHAEDDPEFRSWPPHCVRGTTGQQKPAATLLDRRVTVPGASPTAIAGAAQILFEKQSVNVFDSPHLPALLEALAADRYLVYGVVTEICVQHAAFGLLATGKPVTIVRDAVRSLNSEAAAAMFHEWEHRGGATVTIARLIADR